MSNTFLQRLRQNSLTDSDQYRMIAKSESATDKPLRSPSSDDWKNWELIPVTTGPYTVGSEKQQSAEVVTSVQRAMEKLDE